MGRVTPFRAMSTISAKCAGGLDKSMISLLEILTKWEPLWLFVLLTAELVFSILIWRMARIEFWYDKEWNERKAARRKRQFNFENLTDGEGK